MAGDWIKLECTTPDKPEIVQMATTLRIDQDAVVGKLLRVWVWADQNSVPGEKVKITAAFIDRLTARRGFAAAMRAAGWLTGDDGGMTFPNFDRHNGATAKARAESNRRMKKSRETKPFGCANVAENPQQKPQPEKRREEDTTHTPRAGEPEPDDDAGMHPPGIEPPLKLWVAECARYLIPEWYAKTRWENFSAKGWHSGRTPLKWKRLMPLVKRDFVNDGSPMTEQAAAPSTTPRKEKITKVSL